MEYLLGLDVSGGKASALLLSRGGRIIAVSECEYAIESPFDGAFEMRADDVYRATCSAIRMMLKQSTVNPVDILALSISGAAHSAVLLDEAFVPVRSVLYWTDKRAQPQTNRLLTDHLDRVRDLTRNTPSPMWALPQLMWLREREPEVMARVKTIMSVKDYVRFRLTGDFVTDVTDANGFMLGSIDLNTWSPFLCSLCGIMPEMLPDIVPSRQVLSPITSYALQDTGLDARTLVIAGAANTVMEFLAAGAISPNQVVIKLATSGRICPIAERPISDPQIICCRHIIDGLWCSGTATDDCTKALTWYRDALYQRGGTPVLTSDYGALDRIAREAAAIPAGSEGLMFHPYLSGDDSSASSQCIHASFTGLSARHSGAHFSRALLEGVAYSLMGCMETLKHHSINPQEARLIGLGTRFSVWGDILSSMLGIPLYTLESGAPALGSAMLAGVACGVFLSFEEAVQVCVRMRGGFTPNADNQEIYRAGFKRYQRVTQALAAIDEQTEGRHV